MLSSSFCVSKILVIGNFSNFTADGELKINVELFISPKIREYPKNQHESK
jgi:hypothetical protein